MNLVSKIQNYVEALIFVSESGIQLNEIEEVFKDEKVRESLEISIDTSITSDLILEVI